MKDGNTEVYEEEKVQLPAVIWLKSVVNPDEFLIVRKRGFVSVPNNGTAFLYIEL
jgi:hypothetical protein